MIKFIRIFLLILIIIGIGLICTERLWVPKLVNHILAPAAPAEEATPVKDAVYTNTSANDIQVSLPFLHAVTETSFGVTGSAKGAWFFEGSFPVQVYDAKGNLLASAPAKAEENWETPGLVMFRADFAITASYDGPATVVLKKDNPSGLAANDASLSFPITIEGSPATEPAVQ